LTTSEPTATVVPEPVVLEVDRNVIREAAVDDPAPVEVAVP
jgi:hypothetical protein